MSFPENFLEKYRQILPADDFEKFIEFSKKPLRKSIRVNILKISVPDFKLLAEQKGWTLESIPWCGEGFWIDRADYGIPLGKTIEHACGLFFIQEASSMLPVSVLMQEDGLQGGLEEHNSEPKYVLDICAAPGAKTTQIAALMNNGNLLVVNEFSASRIKKLAFNLARSGVANCVITNKNGNLFGEEAPEFFDHILIDAPCTGEGTIRKDPNALDNWSEKKICLAAGLQKQILDSAFQALKPGGSLVYSTCTLASEENEDVVNWLLDKYPDAKLFDLSRYFADIAQKYNIPNHNIGKFSGNMMRIWPFLFNSEGFFAAKITKGGIAVNQTSFRHPKNKLRRLSKKEFTELEKYFQKEWDFVLEPFFSRLFAKDSRFLNEGCKDGKLKVFLTPEGFEKMPIKKFDRAGIQICEMFKNDIRLSHDFAIVFGNIIKKRSFEVDVENCKRFYAGLDIDADELNINRGQVIIKFKNYPFGLAKIVNGRLKNNLPRHFAQEVF